MSYTTKYICNRCLPLWHQQSDEQVRPISRISAVHRPVRKYSSTASTRCVMSPSAVSWRWKRKSGPTDVNASIQPSLQNPLWSSFEKSEEVPVDGVKSVSHAILDLELLIGRASRFLGVNYGDHVHLFRSDLNLRNPETDGWAEDVHSSLLHQRDLF